MSIGGEGPLWLVGAGNMGGAMLRGWIEAGVAPAQITVIDPVATGLPAGLVAHVAPPPDGATPALIVLAVKPQLIDAVAPGIAPALAPETVLVSILAGVEIASLRRRMPAPRAVVRAMPNTPAAIGKGVTALYADGLDTAARPAMEGLFAPLGSIEWIDDEAMLDAVTALSGCGPAFLFRFIDALAQAGEGRVKPADQAGRMALATVAGSAMLAVSSDESPALLADRVASPGGATRAGLDVLDQDEAIVALIRRTLDAAARRSAEMAATARG